MRVSSRSDWSAAAKPCFSKARSCFSSRLRTLCLRGLRKSPESETARMRTSEVSSFCRMASHFPAGVLSTPVDKTTIVFFPRDARSEEHTSELQSRLHLVCRLLLEKKKHTI